MEVLHLHQIVDWDQMLWKVTMSVNKLIPWSFRRSQSRPHPAMREEKISPGGRIKLCKLSVHKKECLQVVLIKPGHYCGERHGAEVFYCAVGPAGRHKAALSLCTFYIDVFPQLLFG